MSEDSIVVEKMHTKAELDAAVAAARAEARTETLKGLGFDSAKSAQEQIAAWKASAEIAKTMPDVEKRGSDYAARLKAIADRDLAALPEHQRAAIAARGKTLEQQLDYLDFIREAQLAASGEQPKPTGQETAAKPQSAAPVPGAPKPPVIPASSTGAPPPPPPAVKPQNRYSRFKELEASDPTGAALYYQTFKTVIESERPATESN